LTDADTHGRQGIPGVAVAGLECGGQRDPGTAHPERVAEGDRSAVRVDVLSVIGQAKEPQASEGLGGEGFVDLDDVDVVE
jgi:hypothetical protein